MIIHSSILDGNARIIILAFDVTIVYSCNGMANTKCDVFKIFGII